MPYFHSKDFGNYDKGVFAKTGLERRDREVLLGDLCELIHDRLVVGLTVRISIGEYERLTTQVFRSRHGTAYGFAVNMALMGAYAAVKEMGVKPEFNILIEDGHRNANQVANILTGLRDFPDRFRELFKDQIIFDLRVLTSGLGTKKDHPILQCADMLAYAEWQSLSEGDPAIWNALRSRPHYKMLRIKCDDVLIKEFVDEGVRFVSLGKKWKAVREREAKRRVSEFQSGDDDGSSRRPKSCKSRDGSR